MKLIHEAIATILATILTVGIAIGVIGAIIWGIWALFHVGWKTSEEVVSGIVYENPELLGEAA